jgi:signal transduction histidine kinase
LDSATGELIAKLVGRIVHDFNNPLAAILGFADLLRNPGLTPEKRERYVGRVYEQAQKLSQLVETMAWFATMPPAQAEKLDLARLVQDVFALREGGMHAAGIALARELPGKPVTVTGDKAALARAINALLNNVEQAFKESPQEDRRAILCCGSGNGEGFVDVADSGGGIPAGMDEQVFEPFFTTRRSGGLGLGLTVARTLLKRQGGNLVLRREGVAGFGGACFRLTLPLDGAQ